jgi:tRNA pseudouridine38-40 synthase
VGGNAQLPRTVRIADGRAVQESFHARHSAVARSYDYLIANTPVAPALLANRVLWCRDRLDAQRMHRALQDLLGERDFSAFRASSCQSRTPMRFVSQALLWRTAPGYLQLRLTANAFLHHMVRNIVGSVIEIGRGAQSAEWLAELLLARDRRRAAATAPPQGLCLSQVHYPIEFAIPLAPVAPYLQEIPTEPPPDFSSGFPAS